MPLDRTQLVSAISRWNSTHPDRPITTSSVDSYKTETVAWKTIFLEKDEAHLEFVEFNLLERFWRWLCSCFSSKTIINTNDVAQEIFLALTTVQTPIPITLPRAREPERKTEKASTPGIKSDVQKELSSTEEGQQLMKEIATIHSGRTEKLPFACHGRQDFLDAAKQGTWKRHAVIVSSSSELVPAGFVDHLMRDKRKTALGKKYIKGARITNMEGVLHIPGVVPITTTTMLGDYMYDKVARQHTIRPLPPREGRQILLCATIHPDFEDEQVMMKVVEAGDAQVKGKPFTGSPLCQRHDPSSEEFSKELPNYERSLHSHMIYHLMSDHTMPARKELNEGTTYTIHDSPSECLQYLDAVITAKDTDLTTVLRNHFVLLNGHLISLEALFNIYLHQMRNEFSVFEALCPQKYVYVFAPPKIFAQALGEGNVVILNRLHMLALKQLNSHSPLKNLGLISYGDTFDKPVSTAEAAPKTIGPTEGAIALMEHIFPGRVLPSTAVFPEGRYSPPPSLKDAVLIEKNNSDSFGNNIVHEGPHGSRDGAIGNFSDAAVHLQPEGLRILEV